VPAKPLCGSFNAGLTQTTGAGCCSTTLGLGAQKKTAQDKNGPGAADAAVLPKTRGRSTRWWAGWCWGAPHLEQAQKHYVEMRCQPWVVPENRPRLTSTRRMTRQSGRLSRAIPTCEEHPHPHEFQAAASARPSCPRKAWQLIRPDYSSRAAHPHHLCSGKRCCWEAYRQTATTCMPLPPACLLDKTGGDSRGAPGLGKTITLA